MKPSIHYYVLSLNNHTSKLYEGFRDQLIDIQHMGFPYHFPAEQADRLIEDLPAEELRASLIETNKSFNEYYDQEPLGLIIIGAPRSVTIFQSVMTHPGSTLGTISGDFTNFSPHDLEKVIWPVLMATIAGNRQNAMSDLETASAGNTLLSGIDAVASSAFFDSSSILFVEEDFHVSTNIMKKGHSQIADLYDDLWEVFNDVVDIHIARVLEAGGHVMFMDAGTMGAFGRIALVQ
ncbi:MAG: hypothetical protein WBQ23_12955 [Bacteroidota bacterium]